MSEQEFKKLIETSDIANLKKYLNYPKVISLTKFVSYLSESNPNILCVLIKILHSKYDLNDIIKQIITLDQPILLEKVLSHRTKKIIDIKKIVPLTLPNGRVSMAKSIYEYNCELNSFDLVEDLLSKHTFKYNCQEISIDSFVLAMHNRHYKDMERMMKHLDLSFWDNFTVKYTTKHLNIKFLKKILCRTDIDPSANSNFAFRSVVYTNTFKANELMKHPAVPANPTTQNFAHDIILYGWWSSLHKILTTGDKASISQFKEIHMVGAIVRMDTYALYMMIKFNILNENLLSYKKYLNDPEIASLRERLSKNDAIIQKNLKVINENLPKSYIEQVDPVDIYSTALRRNDLTSIKNINNFAIVISPVSLLEQLIIHGKVNNETVTYVLDHIVDTYTLYSLLRALMCNDDTFFDKPTKNKTAMFNKITEKIFGNPNLKLQNLIELYGKSNTGVRRDLIINSIIRKFGENAGELFKTLATTVETIGTDDQLFTLYMKKIM